MLIKFTTYEWMKCLYDYGHSIPSHLKGAIITFSIKNELIDDRFSSIVLVYLPLSKKEI